MTDSPLANFLNSQSGLITIILGFLAIAVAIGAIRYYKNPNAVQRDLQDVTALESEIKELRQECLQLRQQLEQQADSLINDYRHQTFEQLRSLLTQYKSAQQMVSSKPDFSAKNLVAMFTPLDNLIQSWGYESIGVAWEQTTYDPKLHEPDDKNIQVGELVYVRFVGYRQGQERILAPAKVSRSLPARANS